MVFFVGLSLVDSNTRPVREWANEGSVSPVGSAKGKRPEFVSAKRSLGPATRSQATIERTDNPAGLTK